MTFRKKISGTTRTERGMITYFNKLFLAPKIAHRKLNLFKILIDRFLYLERSGRVIFGILDLTKIRCGNREDDKYLDGIRDLTAAREAGLAKIWAWDAGFFSPVCREFGKL